MSIRRCSSLLLVAALSGSLAACPRPAPPVDAGHVATAEPTSLREVLGAGDVFEVRVYEEKDLSGVFRVEDDGRVAYPLLGIIDSAGLTATELAEVIRSGLADGFLQAPQVTVFVTEFNSRKVSVLGQVARPGRYRYRTGMTLVEAIAEAGGTTESAVLQSVRVTRRSKDGDTSLDVAFKEITRGTVSDFPLLPGDIVFVAQSAVK